MVEVELASPKAKRPSRSNERLASGPVLAIEPRGDAPFWARPWVFRPGRHGRHGCTKHWQHLLRDWSCHELHGPGCASLHQSVERRSASSKGKIRTFLELRLGDAETHL